MFIAEALAAFSKIIMAPQSVEEPEKVGKQIDQADKKQENEEQELEPGKRPRSKSHDLEFAKSKKQEAEVSQRRNECEKKGQAIGEETENKELKQNDQEQFQYASFEKGQKIVVKQTFENGWWFGHPVNKPTQQGFFPSNYVRVGAPPPPPPSKQKLKRKKSEDQDEVFDPSEKGVDWLKQELEKVQNEPIKSEYYQGIKGYKAVKINEKNQKILNGNYVHYDVNTGIAKVPVKDQSPTSKAVRQMGYYFDLHQWNQQRNQNPNQKARPDPRKKKAKKLNLKMMD